MGVSVRVRVKAARHGESSTFGLADFGLKNPVEEGKQTHKSRPRQDLTYHYYPYPYPYTLNTPEF